MRQEDASEFIQHFVKSIVCKCLGVAVCTWRWFRADNGDWKRWQSLFYPEDFRHAPRFWSKCHTNTDVEQVIWIWQHDQCFGVHLCHCLFRPRAQPPSTPPPKYLLAAQPVQMPGQYLQIWKVDRWCHHGGTCSWGPFPEMWIARLHMLSNGAWHAKTYLEHMLTTLPTTKAKPVFMACFSPLRVSSCLCLLEVFPPKAISQEVFEMEIEAYPPQGKENTSLISGMILKTIKVSRLLSCT